MRNQQAFTESEKIGRKAFEEFICQTKSSSKLVFTDGAFDHWDAELDDKYEIEIKVRKYYTEQFSTLVMNIEKYESMMKEIYNKHFVNGFYVNFVEDADGKITKLYYWSLDQIFNGLRDKSYKTNYFYAPKTTAVASEKVSKLQIELPKNKAIKYELVDNKWIKL